MRANHVWCLERIFVEKLRLRTFVTRQDFPAVDAWKNEKCNILAFGKLLVNYKVLSLCRVHK
jgi:hypothetical protein